jgi:quinol-cytochrome oxidoreductase complex cytochrome b subunit
MRPEIADIDRAMAELEGLTKKEDQSLEPTPEQASRIPMWLKVVGIAAIVDIGARLFIPSSESFVLVLEAGIFIVAAVALVLPLLRRPSKLTGLRRKLHTWFGAAFTLGALRSGLWGFGLPVEYANLTIFILALVGLGVAYIVKRRNPRSTEQNDEE